MFRQHTLTDYQLASQGIVQPGQGFQDKCQIATLVNGNINWTDPKNLGGTIDLLSSVRKSGPYVRPDGFRLNGFIFCSDFWYQGSFLWYLEHHEAGFFFQK